MSEAQAIVNRVAQRHSSRGFSLIEVLVGMTLGLLGIIIMFQVFAVSEEYRRTTTSGGDAQQGGAIALFTIERDVRQAGHSLNDPAYLGCRVNAYDEGPPARQFTFTLAPVVITQGAGSAPDSITVTYGSSSLYAAPAGLTQNMPSPSANFQVDNRYGFAPGDLVIAVEAGKDCSLAQVTNLPGAPGQSENLIHNSGNYTATTGAQVSARYNRPGGLPAPFDVSYTTNGKLHNLGPLPINNTYSAVGGNLALQSTIANSAAPQAIVEGIVDLQAQYGKDDGVNNGTVNGAVYAADDGVVDRFDTVTPATAADWARVLAVRLAVVARSAQPERPDLATGLCSATTAAPTWAGGAFDLSADPDWQCYRYKILQTTVAVRNMIWKP